VNIAGTTRPRVEFFDCLRALAITFVVIGHYRGADFFPGGAIGVPIFFCLSGYLITAILLQEESFGWPSVWRFVVRRLLRVYPVYVLSVVMIYLILRSAESTLLPEYVTALPRLLTFTYAPKNWLGMGVGVFWTLQIEFWFYITLPIIMLIVGRGRAFTATVLVALASLLAYRLSFPATPLPAMWADNLLIGSVVALAAHHSVGVKTLGKWYAGISTGCLVLLILIATFISVQDRVITWKLQSVIACAITAIWIAAFLGSKHNVVMPLAAWIGRISYSLYLVHAIPLDYLDRIWWPATAALTYSKLWGVLLASVAVASLLHYTIEKPFIKLGKKLTSWPPTTRICLTDLTGAGAH
jgi:peptidoglycan/LPS O-acetylase OafA/YrhL